MLTFASGCRIDITPKSQAALETTSVSSQTSSEETTLVTPETTTTAGTTTTAAATTTVTTVPVTVPKEAVTVSVTTPAPPKETVVTTAASQMVQPKTTQAPVTTAAPIATTVQTTTAAQPTKQLTPITDNYVYRNLPENKKVIYNQIVTAIKNFAPSVAFSGYKPTVQEIKETYAYIIYNEPTCQYLSYQFSYMGNPVSELYLSYTETQAQAQAMQNAVDQKANAILKGITPTMTQYDIAKYLHDSIIKGCTYDLSTKYCATMYGALVEGKAHCQGYSYAYLYLCKKAGIDCTNVVGFASEEHMWNMNLIDGKWYHTDLTWDDQDHNAQFKEPLYNYFNCLLSDVSGKRQVYTDNPIPPAYNGTEANYFYKNGYFILSPDQTDTIVYNQIVSILKGETKYVSIKCKDSAVYQSVKQKLIDQQKIFELYHFALADLGKSSSEARLYYLCDDDINAITFCFV